MIFRCGVEVGKDVTIEELRRQGFDAFYLAVGAQKSSSLGIPGEDLQGVWGGIDFLREANAGARPAIGKKVVVVGGGNVAMDVARTAVRLGAEVTVAYRRKESDMARTARSPLSSARATRRSNAMRSSPPSASASTSAVWISASLNATRRAASRLTP